MSPVARCTTRFILAPLVLLGCCLVAVFAQPSGAAPPPAADSAPQAPAVEITVYAAASLREALQEIAPICESAAGGRFIFNFGGSNDLARQIVAANKADVFFSADEAWMDHVAKEGLVDPASRRTILSNRLVVVVPEGSHPAIASAASLATVRRLALANPDAVPAGRYAKAWLLKAGVWAKVSDKVVGFPDVRATLAAVESGAVDAGVVYKTDARVAHHAQVAFEVPEEDAPHIAYAVAAMQGRPSVAAARRAIDCFGGADARAVFERLGFIVPAHP
jgi:molybdate transport system substrate-binding protein